MPDQARKQYGDALIDWMVESPTLNQRCYRCGEHFGLVCECSPLELKEWVAENGRKFHWEVCPENTPGNKRTEFPDTNKRTRGRPKKWASDAERKRAERKGR